MIRSVVAELHLLGPGAGRERQQLVPQADTENRNPGRENSRIAAMA